MYASAAAVINAIAKQTGEQKPEEQPELAQILLQFKKSIAGNEGRAIEKMKRDNFRKEAGYREIFLEKFGSRYVYEDFNTYNATEKNQIRALTICKKYAENLTYVLKEGMGLVLLGNVGTGKNHLAYSILKQVIRAGYSFDFGELDKIIRRIREPWTTKKSTEQHVIDQYCKVDLLLIEEVGIQGKTDIAKSLLFEILNNRYNRKKATILITNYSAGELQEYLDFGGKGRLWDRFKGGLMTFVEFDWESYRGKK